MPGCQGVYALSEWKGLMKNKSQRPVVDPLVFWDGERFCVTIACFSQNLLGKGGCSKGPAAHLFCTDSLAFSTAFCSSSSSKMDE